MYWALKSVHVSVDEVLEEPGGMIKSIYFFYLDGIDKFTTHPDQPGEIRWVGRLIT